MCKYVKISGGRLSERLMWVYFYQAVSFGDNIIGILDALSSNLTSYLDFSPDTEIVSDNIGNYIPSVYTQAIYAGALKHFHLIKTST